MSALNDCSRTIRLPSNLAQGLYKNKKEISPEHDEIINNLPFCCNLYDEINDEGDVLIDIIPNPNADNPEIHLNSKEEIKRKVDLILRVLDEREKTIIEKYFGLNGIESNLEDLGIEFNCTKERVRQLKDKAIKKLRNESYSLFNYL
jgi:RNA polymerase sigma factor (sigma-70 family)